MSSIKQRHTSVKFMMKFISATPHSSHRAANLQAMTASAPSSAASSESSKPSKSANNWSLRQKPFSFPPGSRRIAKNHKNNRKSWTRTSYFDVRQQKLLAQAPAAETHVLRGVIVYFTGVKSASQRKLEALVWRNGGVVHKVWRRRSVTHVVADNLAASKIEKELNALPADRAVVVTPTWLLSSLKNGEKLPTWEFRVVKGLPGVKNVATFFNSSKGNVQKDKGDNNCPGAK